MVKVFVAIHAEKCYEIALNNIHAQWCMFFLGGGIRFTIVMFLPISKISKAYF